IVRVTIRAQLDNECFSSTSCHTKTPAHEKGDSEACMCRTLYIDCRLLKCRPMSHNHAATLRRGDGIVRPKQMIELLLKQKHLRIVWQSRSSHFPAMPPSRPESAQRFSASLPPPSAW